MIDINHVWCQWCFYLIDMNFCIWIYYYFTNILLNKKCAKVVQTWLISIMIVVHHEWSSSWLYFKWLKYIMIYANHSCTGMSIIFEQTWHICLCKHVIHVCAIIMFLWYKDLFNVEGYESLNYMFSFSNLKGGNQ